MFFATWIAVISTLEKSPSCACDAGKNVNSKQNDAAKLRRVGVVIGNMFSG
jgi:hypothetical protein